MAKAWAFYRCSTDKQELSVEGQREACQTYANANGWVIVREFQPPKGYASGLSIDSDPAFCEMARLAETRTHGVQALLVYDVSRFGRLSPADKMGWEWHFSRYGIQVIYVKEGFREDQSVGDLITKVVRHSEAHEFSKKLGQTTLRGQRDHARLGHSAGGSAPYGYDRMLIDAAGNHVKVLRKGEHKADKLQRVVFVPSPTQKLIVQEIFERFDKGEGYNGIFEDLNKRQVPPPRGDAWSKSLLHYLLQNRTYLGERIYNKRNYALRRQKKGKMFFKPREDWEIKKNAHSPIIDEDLFDRVQKRMEIRKSKFQKGRDHHTDHLLAGLAICGNCGYRFTGWNKPRPYYSCSAYHRAGKKLCRSVHASGDEMDRYALDSIRKLLQSPTWKSKVSHHVKKLLDEQYGTSAENRQEDLKRTYALVQRQIGNVLDFVKQGGSYSDTMRQELDRLEAQKREIETTLKQINAAGQAKTKLDSLVESILDIAEHFDDLWNNNSTMDEKKAFIKAFIYEVAVKHTPNSIDAYYYLFTVPQLNENDTARGIIKDTSGCDLQVLSLANFAGVGFEPTTFGL